MKIKVPGKYRKNEFVSFIIELARLMQPEVYCEVGVYQCHTINRLLPYVGKAIGIDIEDRLAHFDKSRRNWEFFKGTSDKFVNEYYKGPEIDLLFIDADHSRNSVLADLDLMEKLVRPWTGLVLLHDTYPIRRDLIQPGYCSDAWKAAKEIHKKMPQWEIVTLPGPWAGLSILRRLVEGKHGYMDRSES